MKRKRLNLGYSDFKSIIENNNYFVDKSLLIEELIESEKSVVLLPRPRRFGKTVNLSMLKYFFDIQEPENENLFKHLKIWNSDDEIRNHCGSYPVIFITFKDAKEKEWEDCYGLIISEIVKIYNHHRYLLDSDVLYDNEKNKYKNILNETGKKIDYQNSLKNLSEYLYRYHNQKVVILIDEYDTPIQAGYKNFYDEIIAFMRNLMSGAYKDNPYLYKGVITGILRVSRESIFSGLNNISVHSILDTRFSDKFGFTEDEVKQLLDDFNVRNNFSTIQKWYNGYSFGNTNNIYNPWSILNFVTEEEDGFKTYWVNTSSDVLIKQEIKKKDADYIRENLLTLINNSSIIKDIEENFVFPDLDSRKELLWTLLTFSGYLTKKNKISRKEYELIIPNYEIKTIFQDTILEWLEGEVRIRKSLLKETTEHLTENRLTKFETGFRQIIGDTFSYYDTAKNHEYVFQAYLLGVLAIIGDDYIIKSNRESGEGRYDILMIPHDTKKNGVVIEIKQTQNQQANETDSQLAERINTEIADALNQIERNQYYKELIDNNIKPGNIIQVPIVFAGKTPYIRKIEG